MFRVSNNSKRIRWCERSEKRGESLYCIPFMNNSTLSSFFRASKEIIRAEGNGWGRRRGQGSSVRRASSNKFPRKHPWRRQNRLFIHPNSTRAMMAKNNPSAAVEGRLGRATNPNMLYTHSLCSRKTGSPPPRWILSVGWISPRKTGTASCIPSGYPVWRNV